jgi:acyl-CoA reductase-like NAD-dependent aldehyde dehydrogenase
MLEMTDSIEVQNPFDGTRVGAVKCASASDIRDAVKRAREAFRTLVPQAIDRYDILMKASQTLACEREDLARLICLETGKPIRECCVEVDRASTTLSCSAQESLRLDGVVQPCDTTPQRCNRHAYVHRIPLGVVAAITPFNFPLNIPAHKIGPAFAGGNAVIVKPSPLAPLATERLVQILHNCGVDEGLVQIVHGGADVVETLVRCDVQAVSFTGSTEIGPTIASWSAGKKLVMELGGNDPIVVMEDADLKLAAETIVAHRFGSSGQRCTSCKRALIQAPVWNEMAERLLALVAGLVVGNPADETTDVGPLITEESARRAIERTEAATANGARVLCGGTRRQAVVAPTLVSEVKPADVLFQEETFAPVLPMTVFRTMDEAIHLVNCTRYGLQSGIFTNRVDTITRAFERFDVGALVVNGGPALRIEPLPFGGVKESGIGREGVRYAVEEFTQLKTLIL